MLRLVEQIVKIFYSMFQEPCYIKVECYCDNNWQIVQNSK